MNQPALSVTNPPLHLAPEPPVKKSTYSPAFYDGQSKGSRLSAAQTLPLLQKWLRISSVLDVGCGVGTWLAMFREAGITDVLGLDGAYVSRDRLHIPEQNFKPADLTSPPHLGRKFDLVMSLEVAEHLPATAADGFVRYLTSFSKVVMFSAAIPGQGGKHHVNEQWPDYWVKRFEQQGFVVIDCLRPLLWNNPNVEWWYAQNLFLFVKEDELEKNAVLRDLAKKTARDRLAVVHPRAYQSANRKLELVSLRRAVRLARSIVEATLKRPASAPEPFTGT